MLRNNFNSPNNVSPVEESTIEEEIALISMKMLPRVKIFTHDSRSNAGVHLFTFVVLLIGSAVLLECTTTGSGIVSAIRESMMGLMMQPYSESATNTLNMIQESIGCCGADGPNDYLSLRRALPSECRDTVTGNAFFYGCADEVTWFLEEKSKWITNIAISIAALEMFISVLSVILVKALQKEEKFNYNR
ncbi:Tetraspanin/Peripherin,Tetraspanin, EC2 domain [Cinara cedri]|uniref:Tetraspanin/Peripherin,Tetraspanin, EC2 domain n=1 Tax=Cinara cedri TaxID=506608 RepID=A0A5E4MED8_9HEMI|nr:Tetraspanin/Peripherin,Tetraspanin, EC2 domain [Cinara cedri]